MSGSLLNDLIFAADPAAHVFDGRIYMYVSYDEPYTNSYDSMVSYHALSSDDLVNWVDHGRILHLDQVDWALSHMWAIDANYYQGKYYLVFCAFHKETGTFQTGLAVSLRPEGPFHDLGPISGVEWGQDPTLFIDLIDGVEIPYLLWGGRGAILIGELNSDLRSIKSETITNLSAQLGGYEGPFLHKFEGKYHLTYPALQQEQWPQRMTQAIATNVLGPYEKVGIYIDEFSGNAGTIHGSVVNFKDRWYAAYHSGWVSGSETARSLMFDEITMSEEGKINPVVPQISPLGIDRSHGKSWEIKLAAGAIAGNGGKIFGAKLVPDSAQELGHVTGMTHQEFGFRIPLPIGRSCEYEISIKYRASADQNIRVLAGSHLFFDGIQNQSYEQYINRGTALANTEGKWREQMIGRHTFTSGEHQIRISQSHNQIDGQSHLDIQSIIARPILS
jgi:hypothetical protein